MIAIFWNPCCRKMLLDMHLMVTKRVVTSPSTWTFLLVFKRELEPLQVHLLKKVIKMNIQRNIQGIILVVIMLFMIMSSMKNLHELMGQNFVVHIVVCITINFQDAWTREKDWREWNRRFHHQRESRWFIRGGC